MSLKSLIFPTIFAVGAIGAAAVHEIFKESDKISMSKAMEIAEENMDISSKEVLQSVEEAIKKSDTVFRKEQSKLKVELGDWYKTTGFEEKCKDIQSMRDEVVKKIESDFHLSDKEADILLDAEKKVASYKDQIGYSSRLASLQNEIDSAKSMYDMQKQTLKLTSNDDNMYQELKKTAKRVKNTSVENAEREMKALKSRLDERVASINAEKTRKLDAIHKDLASQIESATKKYDIELEKMSESKIERIKVLKESIVRCRSSEDTDIVNAAKDLKDKADEISKANSIMAADIYKEMPRHKRLAYYFTRHKWPKLCVLAVAALPLVPVGIAVVKYLAFIKDILSAMNA